MPELTPAQLAEPRFMPNTMRPSWVIDTHTEGAECVVGNARDAHQAESFCDALNALAAKLAQAEARCAAYREFAIIHTRQMYHGDTTTQCALAADECDTSVMAALDPDFNPPAAQPAPSTAECADEPEPGFPDPPCVRNGHKVAQSASGSQYCTRCGKRMGETGQTAPTTEGK